MEVRRICRRKEKVVDKYRLIRYNTKRTAGGWFVCFDFHCGEGVLMARGRFFCFYGKIFIDLPLVYKNNF